MILQRFCKLKEIIFVADAHAVQALRREGLKIVKFVLETSQITEKLTPHLNQHWNPKWQAPVSRAQESSNATARRTRHDDIGTGQGDL
ncbi:hypothetical protein WR25_22783 [Diploscapter pachys]|uniref:Uncharacterized protein n=1 Tax=Diploscapter pachys TaxID=2018661 RepID=A0A2A2JJX1_9BILA|nr:hypothetical protein WR25_22783 [Diploscapter pachys]